jgi:pyruvate/2-oxoglutarate dehydrogenase complex dihydrolipoamide dehydrogenase (E3) component
MLDARCVAYTIPAIASVGLGEAEVRQRFANVRGRHEQASDLVYRPAVSRIGVWLQDDGR